MYDMTDFIDYLIKTDKLIATSKIGLVDNAPQEAIDAYEEFKKYEEERIASGEDWD
jgi:hypothetical protein